LRQSCGLLSPDEEMLLTVLRADGPDASHLARRFPHLEPGLRMLQATESYAPGNAAFDGGAGSVAAPPERFSVSALETLGRCPLRYFFRHVLRVRELDEEAVAQQIAAWEMGSEVHRFLERLYGELMREGAFDAEADRLVRIALTRLGPVWDATLGAVAARSAKRLPLLWEQIGEEWRSALRAFVEEDLRRLAGDGMKPAGLEERLEEEIDLGEEVAIRLVGRTDRRLSGPGGTLVGDYKSSGNLRNRGDLTEMLKGRALQIPLYWLMAGESSAVELLGVGPGYDHEEPDALEAGRRMEFQGFSSDEAREGFLETLRVLVDLARRGRFPLRPDDRGCRFCPYERACRRTHPPTQEREGHARDTRRYYSLKKKNKSKRPTLNTIPDYQSSSAEET
jgi:ATP-dependent helicase/nuclease subunit B